LLLVCNMNSERLCTSVTNTDFWKWQVVIEYYTNLWGYPNILIMMLQPRNTLQSHTNFVCCICCVLVILGPLWHSGIQQWDAYTSSWINWCSINLFFTYIHSLFLSLSFVWTLSLSFLTNVLKVSWCIQSQTLDCMLDTSFKKL